MKAKVNKGFRDKNTGEIYKVGRILTVSKARFAEIQKVDKNLIEEIKEEK